MKAILISIQPKWCELIASGEKTVEVRTTQPKLELPFKCYIYCTKGKTHDDILTFAEWDESGYIGDYLANGAIIGEFICDEIISFYKETCDHPELDGCPVEEWLMWDASEELLEQIGTDPEDIEKCTCLTEKEIFWYTRGDGYGWHIKDLVIYDKPKRLDQFSKVGFDRIIPLKRPPQSWMYVEEIA